MLKRVKKMKERLRENVIGFLDKLQKDQSGLAVWEIILAMLISIVIVGVLLKVAGTSVTELWDLLIDKFKSLLTV